MMYRLCYPWIVYPLISIQNLCTYVSTRSRLSVDLSKPLGSGSYDTIIQWLLEQGSLSGPIQCPNGDIGVAFDKIVAIIGNGYKSNNFPILMALLVSAKGVV